MSFYSLGSALEALLDVIFSSGLWLKNKKNSNLSTINTMMILLNQKHLNAEANTLPDKVQETKLYIPQLQKNRC